MKKCKHNFAYDTEKFWCIKCGHTEIRETPITADQQSDIEDVIGDLTAEDKEDWKTDRDDYLDAFISVSGQQSEAEKEHEQIIAVRVNNNQEFESILDWKHRPDWRNFIGKYCEPCAISIYPEIRFYGISKDESPSYLPLPEECILLPYELRETYEKYFVQSKSASGETVEQAANRLHKENYYNYDGDGFFLGFELAAQWQQSQSLQGVVEETENDKIMQQIKIAHKMLDETGVFKRLDVKNLFVIVDVGANLVSDTLYIDEVDAKVIANKNKLGSHFVIRLSDHLSALHSWFEKGIDDLQRD